MSSAPEPAVVGWPHSRPGRTLCTRPFAPSGLDRGRRHACRGWPSRPRPDGHRGSTGSPTTTGRSLRAGPSPRTGRVGSGVGAENPACAGQRRVRTPGVCRRVDRVAVPTRPARSPEPGSIELLGSSGLPERAERLLGLRGRSFPPPHCQPLRSLGGHNVGTNGS